MTCGWSTPKTSSTCQGGPRPTSSRADLVAARTAEKNRVEKLLEDAQIKLSVVASDIFGVSGRDMLAALIAGERDPKALAQLARRRLRAKLSLLEEAFYGHFSDHHAFLLQTMLARIDQATADIATVEAHIDAEIAPFAQAADRLDEITGVGRAAAQVIIAEIGVDMGRFATPGQLVSWARFAPGVKESAGKKKGKATTGHGNPYLARVLGEAAAAAGKTNTFLGERYRRIARRRGTKKAIVAVGRSILIIIWHLLSDPDARFHDTSANWRRWATRSPCSLSPDRHTSTHCLDPAPPGAAACLLTVDFRIRHGVSRPQGYRSPSKPVSLLPDHASNLLLSEPQRGSLRLPPLGRPPALDEHGRAAHLGMAELQRPALLA